MKKKALQWGVLGLCVLITLVFAGLVLPPLTKEKTRSVRIKTAVNSKPSLPGMAIGTNSAPDAAMNQ